MQTVQTQIRLLLDEPSDQGLHCLPFHSHHLGILTEVKLFQYEFFDCKNNILRCPKFFVNYGYTRKKEIKKEGRKERTKKKERKKERKKENLYYFYIIYRNNLQRSMLYTD